MKLCIGEFVFDPEARELRLGARVSRLEPKAAAVLARLAEASTQTVRRDELLDTCWPSAEGSDEALTQAIAQVRRGFGLAPGGARYIHTVARTGYRLMADVRPATPEEAAIVSARTGLAAAKSNSGSARPWFALAVLVVTLSATALALSPHGVGHWLAHHLQ